MTGKARESSEAGIAAAEPQSANENHRRRERGDDPQGSNDDERHGRAADTSTLAGRGKTDAKLETRIEALAPTATCNDGGFHTAAVCNTKQLITQQFAMMLAWLLPGDAEERTRIAASPASEVGRSGGLRHGGAVDVASEGR